MCLSSAEGLMSESGRSAIVDLLAAITEVGDLIPGTGGLRDDLSSEQKTVLRRLVETILARHQ